MGVENDTCTKKDNWSMFNWFGNRNTISAFSSSNRMAIFDRGGDSWHRINMASMLEREVHK